MNTSRIAVKEYKDGKIYLTGPLIVADTPNVNGIVYPRKVVEKMLNEYNQRKTPLFGTTEEKRSYKVLLEDTIAKTNTLELNGNRLEATVEVIDTTSGQAFYQYLMSTEESELGFNTVVMGSIDENNVVRDDAIIVGFSIVPIDMLQ